MPIQFLNRIRGGGSRAFDSDVLSWRDAVTSNGGSVSLARLIVVDQFVFSEKASGAWALTDDYWGFWAENASQALTSLKQRRLASAFNSPTFTADRGYTGDAVSSYIETNFVPLTHALAMTAASVCLSWYERTNIQDNAFVGISETANRVLRGRSRSSSNQTRGDLNSTGFTATATDSRGSWDFVRQASGPAFKIYANAVDLAAPGGSSIAVALSAQSFPLLGSKTAAVADGFSGRSFGFYALGAELSAGQIAARRSAVQAWATSIGANV